MKILHCVESYSPALGGMQEVVKQLSERMVLLGHDVTVACSAHPKREKHAVVKGVKVASFAVGGNFVRGLTGDVDEYKNFLLNSDFDVVVSFAAQQWATDIALPILDQIKGKKVFVPTGFSGFYFPEYQSYFESMKTWMKGYDMNVFLSNDYRDINFARENGITKNMLIPNGAAEDEFLKASVIDIKKKLGIAPDTFLILHVGSYTGIKGQAEACQVFFRSKLKNAALLLIGNSNEVFLERYWYKVSLPLFLAKTYKKGKQLIVTHTLTREETVAAYQAADLFLFPSNIECSPIVLFECMASKTPYLTADVGNSVEITSWSHSGKILPTNKDEKGYSYVNISESVKMLEDLAGDSKVREKLGAAGFDAWKNNFTWEVITKRYEKLYHDLTA